MVKFRKALLRLFVGAFLLHLLFLLGIDSYYWSFLPKEPDVESGRTTRLVFHHGSVRYTSEREFRVFQNGRRLLAVYRTAVGDGYDVGFYIG